VLICSEIMDDEMITFTAINIYCICEMCTIGRITGVKFSTNSRGKLFDFPLTLRFDFAIAPLSATWRNGQFVDLPFASLVPSEGEF